MSFVWIHYRYYRPWAVPRMLWKFEPLPPHFMVTMGRAHPSGPVESWMVTRCRGSGGGDPAVENYGSCIKCSGRAVDNTMAVTPTPSFCTKAIASKGRERSLL